jgi:hypothetical protein
MNEDKVEYVFDQHSNQPPQVISMTQERYDYLFSDARMREMMRCCEDICPGCKQGQPLEFHSDYGVYQHKYNGTGRYDDCKANAIRLRWAKGQAG